MPLPRLFLNDFIDFFARFFHVLFYFCRLDASVQNEIFQRDARDLAADGVKRRNNNCAGSVVYDDIHSRGAFKCANIAPFFAYNLAFISSDGIGTFVIITSEAVELARRWIDVASISFAFLSSRSVFVISSFCIRTRRSSAYCFSVSLQKNLFGVLTRKVGNAFKLLALFRV